VATPQTLALRRVRERDLVLATRRLFDERGMQDAPIEEIARAVGIARGLVYRQFSSKDELYVLTVTTYLDEIAVALEAADGAPGDDPVERLARTAEAFAGYCHAYPAFLDCSVSLMRRPATELREVVSDSVWTRLGERMARCLAVVAGVLRAGREVGAFEVEDPDFTANVLWVQVIGLMHLGRIQVGVYEQAPGVPGLFAVDPGRLLCTVVDAALAVVGARRG